MTEQLPPLQDRLLAAAKSWKAPIDVVELDYGQSYVLAALFGRTDLRESLVFKGGTALHKVHFEDYRFSMDLDSPQSRGREDKIWRGRYKVWRQMPRACWTSTAPSRSLQLVGPNGVLIQRVRKHSWCRSGSLGTAHRNETSSPK